MGMGRKTTKNNFVILHSQGSFHSVINNHSVTKGPPAGRYLLSKPVEKKKTLLRNTTHIKGIMYK